MEDLSKCVWQVIKLLKELPDTTSTGHSCVSCECRIVCGYSNLNSLFTCVFHWLLGFCSVNLGTYSIFNWFLLRNVSPINYWSKWYSQYGNMARCVPLITGVSGIVSTLTWLFSFNYWELWGATWGHWFSAVNGVPLYLCEDDSGDVWLKWFLGLML